jgi:protein SCO1/2
VIVKRTWTRSARLAAPFLAAALAMTTAQAGENLPTPGSYVLHRIQQVPRAALLDASGAPVRSDDKMRGAITLLAFFYSHCEDVAGCPVAWSVFEAVRESARRDPLLSGKLRLVFVSIDPRRDTPAVLRLLETSERGDESDIPWSFLTGVSEASLAPFLATMGQDVGPEIDARGRRTGALQHMLKVFLVDPEGWVREIYSTGFLTPEAALNDARTLALANPDRGVRTEPR